MTEIDAKMKNLICSQGDKEYKSLETLSRHVKFTHEGIGYICCLCDYNAMTSYDLKLHTQSKHEGIKHPCKHCDFESTQARGLVNHTKAKHDSFVKKYNCATMCTILSDFHIYPLFLGMQST